MVYFHLHFLSRHMKHLVWKFPIFMTYFALGSRWYLVNDKWPHHGQSRQATFSHRKLFFLYSSIFPPTKHKYVCTELMQAQSTWVRGWGAPVSVDARFLDRTFFSLEGFFVRVKQWSFWFVIGREMRISLAKNGQCAENVICLVPNTIGVNSFFFCKIHV